MASRTKTPCAQPPPDNPRRRARDPHVLYVLEQGGGDEGGSEEVKRGETGDVEGAQREGCCEGGIRLPRGYNDREWSYRVRSGLV